MVYQVTCFGLYPLEIEASSEVEAKELYETQRGLVKGINPLVAIVATGVSVDVSSPFGLHASDRYEPYTVPVPVEVKPVEVVKAFPDLKPPPVIEPLAAKVGDSVSEEVLIVSN